jgi:hypothetical protein
MFNPIAILSALIATDAPVFEGDDTQEVPVLRMVITPLSAFALNETPQMLNARIQYRHFDTSRDLFTGKVIETTATQMLVEPDAGQDARYPRWRELADVTGCVHFE